MAIPKGNAHNSGVRLARYIMTAKEGERVSLYEIRGFAEPDIVQAFGVIDAMKGANVKQPFFHVQMRNHATDRDLTNAEWAWTINSAEQKLGLTDQPRAIVFHANEQTGERHAHIAWSRLDENTGKTIAQPFYKERLRELAQEMEKKFDLKRTRERRADHEPRSAKRNEFEQSRRLEVDSKAIRQQIKDAYQRSDSGQALQHALAEHDLTLVRGDKRDFVIIDSAGGVHGLNGRLLDDTTKQVKTKLADLTHLPSVEEARAFQRVRMQAAASRTPDHQHPGEERHDDTAPNGSGDISHGEDNKNMAWYDRAFHLFESIAAFPFMVAFGNDNSPEQFYRDPDQPQHDVYIDAGTVTVNGAKEKDSERQAPAPEHVAAEAMPAREAPAKVQEQPQAESVRETVQQPEQTQAPDWSASQRAADRLEAQRLHQLQRAEANAWTEITSNLADQRDGLSHSLAMPSKIMEQVRARALEMEEERRQRDREPGRER
jgi:hypothetical protein